MKYFFYIFVFLMIPVHIFAQNTHKMNTVKIVDNKELILKVDATFVFYPTGFTLICSDTRVYSYLVPGVEFYGLDNLTFYDTGALLDASTKDSLEFSGKSPIVIYESTIRKTQVAMQVDSTSIFLMKRNLTGIKFYKE